MWHACADRYSQLKKKIAHPTPGGFRERTPIRCRSLVPVFVRTRVRSDGNLSEPFFDTAVGPHRVQIWHACADRINIVSP